MRRLSRRQWCLVLAGAAFTLIVVLGIQWRAAISRGRSVPDEPFRVAGNFYYVGATGVTAFLLTGSEGHVLIDGGYPETAPLIIASIAKLGFDIADVKVLLNSHAHADHAGGLRALQEVSGAQLWVSEGDVDVMVAGRHWRDPALGPIRFLGLLGLGRFPAPRSTTGSRTARRSASGRLRSPRMSPPDTHAAAHHGRSPCATATVSCLP